MKNTIIKKWIITAIISAVILGVIFCTTQILQEKKIAGKWEIEGLINDYELKFGDFGEYEYFNINLSEDGVINLFSYPEKIAMLGTYSLLQKKGSAYAAYAVNLLLNNKNGGVEPFSAKITYNSKEDRLYLFFSEDDGLFFKRTEELTTVEITTTGIDYKNQLGKYIYGNYYEYGYGELSDQQNFYEGEVNIIDITNDTIIFDLNHRGLYGEENIIARRDNSGYYYFEFFEECGGYIFLDNDNVTINITKGDNIFILTGKTTYQRIENNSNSNTTKNNTDNESYYKSSCDRNVDSKNLVRYEEEYLNKNFCYTGLVLTYENNNTYSIITDENFDGIYSDNLIYVQDFRESDTTKILQNDIITIYGAFTGVSKDNHPYFKLYYVDIEGVQ